MDSSIQKKLMNNLLPISLGFILIVILFNSFSVLRHRSLFMESKNIDNDVISINKGINRLEANIFLVDVGVRGYLLKQNEVFLDPYKVALPRYEQDLFDLESLLIKYDYPNEEIKLAITAVQQYVERVERMVKLAQEGLISEALSEFEKDYGMEAWTKYGPFVSDVQEFTRKLQARSEDKYKTFVTKSVIIQFLFFVIAFPVIIIALNHILINRKNRDELIRELNRSNGKFIFDSGNGKVQLNERSVIDSMITNLKKASGFIVQLSNGDFSAEWEGLNEKNRHLNKGNLSGELLAMRDHLKKLKKDDERRNWFNDGMSKFSDVIRENQNTLKELCDHFIAGVTKYTNSEQGTLLLVENDQNTEREYLEIKGMYAFDRKRYITKKIELNSGLAGQCYQEGETIYLTNVPSDYVNVTSGLGEAKPDTLLIVPIRTVKKVVGVLELASLKKFEKHVIEFVENLASNLATAISVTRSNENTLILLRKTQEQTEELKATEEEIRQNMEELQATQEQMSRKNDEVSQLLEETKENEEVMKLQLEEFETLKRGEEELVENLEAYRSMMLDVLNELPYKVFLKDEEGKIFLVNKKVAESHNMGIEELIGKSDYDFVDKETADLWRKEELEIIKKGEGTFVFEEDLGNGKRILETIKKRFYIRPIKQIGLLGIQKDITNDPNAADKLREFKNMQKVN